MSINRINRIAITVPTILFALAAGPAAAQPGTTAFTYQGHLTEAAAPAEGLYDLRFKLFDGPASPNQVSTTLCLDNVAVHAGLFSAELDFGRTFVGEERWLQIEVRRDTGLTCASAAGLTILAPRQELTPAPWATFAANAATFNGQPPGFFQNAANLFGTLPAAALSGEYAREIVLSSPENIFVGNGSNLTSLNAANLVGTIPGAALPPGIAFLGASNLFAGANTFTAATTFQGAVTLNGPLNTPATTRFLILPAQAFHLADSTLSMTSTSVAVSGLTPGGTVTLDCGVTLPQGAVITALEAYVLDNDATQRISVELTRNRLAAAGLTSMALVQTTAAGASSAIQTITDSSITSPAIDNSQFGYYLRAIWTTPNPFTNINLRGVRITYTTTTLP